MKAKKIEINKNNLRFNIPDHGKSYIIEGKNSGLYYCKDQHGEEAQFMSSELRFDYMGVNWLINADETLDLIRHMENGEIMTKDGLNFITESEFDSLDESSEEYYKVEFIIKKADEWEEKIFSVNGIDEELTEEQFEAFEKMLDYLKRCGIDRDSAVSLYQEGALEITVDFDNQEWILCNDEKLCVAVRVPDLFILDNPEQIKEAKIIF